MITRKKIEELPDFIQINNLLIASAISPPPTPLRQHLRNASRQASPGPSSSPLHPSSSRPRQLATSTSEGGSAHQLRALLTAEGFPRPTRDTSPFLVPAHSQGGSGEPELLQSARPWILKYTRTVSNLTGAITSAQALTEYNASQRPARLGLAADVFLDAFGYDSTAKLQIANAYDNAYDVDDFVTELCNQGMAKSEASWLHGFVASHGPHA